LALDAVERIGKNFVLLVVHLEPVCLRVATSGMDIRGVAIEQRSRAVIEFDEFYGWPVLDLNAHDALGHFVETFHTAQPAGDNSRHP
ncbi:hypothetical protein RZS08_39270, partial [Arthrospira platensis SPKY1]|nr:hypothetical protein [Arthrospira platensis SPKY1]